MQQTVELQVQEDFVDRLATTRPVQALAELIWNSLDADSTTVKVEFDHDASGLLQAIRVRDDGYGIVHEDAPKFFQRLGGSWKRERKRTRFDSRILHGEEGKGRFRALALGRVAEWKVTVPSSADANSALETYIVTIIRDRPRQATISDPRPATGSSKRGVEVVISEVFKQWQIEESDPALNELTEIFALYLTDYRSIKLSVGSRRIDAAEEIARRDQFQLSPVGVEGKPWVQLRCH